MQTLEPKDNSRFDTSFLRAPIGLFHLSLDGKWLEVNSYFCELLGYQREDFTPLSLMAIAHPEEREEIQAAIHQLQTKQSTNYQKNLRLLTTQNTFIQISLTLSWIEDTPAYLLGIVRELTPQELEQNSENELEKDLLKTLIDTIGDIAFVKDMQGRFLFINQAGLRGINKTLEEIIGKTDIELFGSELGEILIENDRQVFASEKLHEFEEIVDFEGERRIFLTQKIFIAIARET
uniref:PAS domain-containing protein n=1 Tax=Desertifilum tharense IPPAS B-1220 TaxID=1781255 RepID=A0ACD5GU84_9CYAN